MVGQRLEAGRLLLEPCSSRPTPTPLPVCATEGLPCSLPDAIQMLPSSLLDATSWEGGQRNINSHSRASNSRPSCNCASWELLIHPTISSFSPFQPMRPAAQATHTSSYCFLACTHGVLTSDPLPVSRFLSSPPALTSPTKPLLACRIPEGQCWTRARALGPAPNLPKVRSVN